MEAFIPYRFIVPKVPSPQAILFTIILMTSAFLWISMRLIKVVLTLLEGVRVLLLGQNPSIVPSVASRPRQSQPRRSARRNPLPHSEPLPLSQLYPAFATAVKKGELDSDGMTEIEPNLSLDVLLHGDKSGGTTFEVVEDLQNPSDSPVISSHGPTRMAFIIRHERDDWKTEYRFGLVDTLPTKDNALNFTKMRIPDGNCVFWSIKDGLQKQGATLRPDNLFPWIASRGTLKPPAVSFSPQAIPLPVLRHFTLSSMNPTQTIGLDPDELRHLPWSQLTHVRILDVRVSVHDCLLLLSRCSELRELELHSICDILPVPSLLGPGAINQLSAVGRLQLPFLTTLSLTSFVKLNTLFGKVTCPKLEDLSVRITTDTPTFPSAWGFRDWSNLNEFYLACGPRSGLPMHEMNKMRRVLPERCCPVYDSLDWEAFVGV